MATPYLGEIKLFAGNFQIRGWAYCNGQLLSIAQNDALYALLGTTYGGDGVNTFALPNLQSRVALHQGQGPGLTNRVIGEASGVETVTLTSSQLPSHTHQAIATTVAGTATAPANALPAKPSLATTEFLYLNGAATGTTDAPPAAASVSSAGGNQPHDNIQPILALNYLIALEGVFPSQN
jgi:microcystin-dependent protein